MPLDPKFYVPQAQQPLLRRTWLVLATLGVVVAALIAVAPLAQSAGYTTLAQTLYRGFSPLCHQLANRSFHFHDLPFAVCARCTGLYWGLAVGFVAYPAVRALNRLDTPARGWLFLALVPVTVDFLLGYTGLRANTHASRFVTGGILGVAIALYLVPGVLDLRLNWRRLLARRTATATATPAVGDNQATSAPSDYSAPARRIKL